MNTTSTIHTDNLVLQVGVRYRAIDKDNPVRRIILAIEDNGTWIKYKVVSRYKNEDWEFEAASSVEAFLVGTERDDDVESF